MDKNALLCHSRHLLSMFVFQMVLSFYVTDDKSRGKHMIRVQTTINNKAFDVYVDEHSEHQITTIIDSILIHLTNPNLPFSMSIEEETDIDTPVAQTEFNLTTGFYGVLNEAEEKIAVINVLFDRTMRSPILATDVYSNPIEILFEKCILDDDFHESRKERISLRNTQTVGGVTLEEKILWIAPHPENYEWADETL